MKVFVVALLALLVSVQPSVAQTSEPIWPETIILDDQSFKWQDLNRDFLRAAFVKDVLNDNYGQLFLGIGARDEFANAEVMQGNKEGLLSPESMSQEYPWIVPFLYPEEGLPRLLAVNKFTKDKDVRVSFGFPNNLKYLSNSNFQLLSEGSVDFSKNEKYLDVLKIISASAQKLSDASGLKVTYLDRETISDYAEIRIIMESKQKGFDFQSRKGRMQRVYTGGWGRQNLDFFASIEFYIKTGFAFTRQSLKQVDGYILTNGKNEIQMAVCYIPQDYDLITIEKALNECLIRSLGLPGGIPIAGRVKPISHLTYWNDPDMWGKDQTQMPAQPDGISEFDQFMIKTLYNPALKPGMDYIQAQKILMGLE